jgi:hypothetical protein
LLLQTYGAVVVVPVAVIDTAAATAVAVAIQDINLQ